MTWQITKNFLLFLLILVGFILILLLPRERAITTSGPLQFDAHYPFSLELYLESIEEFVTYIKTEKGFGETRGGNPILDEVKRFMTRSLKIIVPAFIISMIVGSLLGLLQFYLRHRKCGKVLSFFSWVFASIPDFFLFIAIQYLLMRAGLPKFGLFGNEEWYSFIIPLISLTIFPLAHMIKVTVVAMENEMGQDYVRTVFSKGLNKVEAIKHMFWNCWSTMVNQSQMVMLYILSSLPIIEKISSYNGAGYQLLQSILNNEDIRALGLMLPFLILMFLVVVISQAIKNWYIPKEVRGGL
ncbi:ABC transporter permease [Filobacillus milosensis]|uniref:ABC transporter permease n=1 Tax=Filobacillus milosensis TaxID=94137 RepID=A0A4Y8IEC3_9BACI|nr:ABC transporter permease [Filobacillus milosensis]TFB14638.1 ABC transporter permease [Filobacillus milosensis]